jgi:hypothetical protein
VRPRLDETFFGVLRNDLAHSVKCSFTLTEIRSELLSTVMMRGHVEVLVSFTGFLSLPGQRLLIGSYVVHKRSMTRVMPL